MWTDGGNHADFIGYYEFIFFVVVVLKNYITVNVGYIVASFVSKMW